MKLQKNTCYPGTIRFTELLEEDPVYKRILEEKAECLVKLELLNFNLDELAGKPVSPMPISG